jgi:hypothetical protein
LVAGGKPFPDISAALFEIADCRIEGKKRDRLLPRSAPGRGDGGVFPGMGNFISDEPSVFMARVGRPRGLARGFQPSISRTSPGMRTPVSVAISCEAQHVLYRDGLRAPKFA